MSEESHVPRAVIAATSDRSDYLKKRHMREGQRRRHFGISDALDCELDSRNARVWGAVFAGCLVAAGVAPSEVPLDFHAGTGPRRAVCAAYRICNRRYGVPTARLAELSERAPSHVGRSIRFESSDVDQIVARWVLDGGPGVVDRVECVPIMVTKEAALALAKAARESGDSPIALASAAVLAASPRLPR